ncbi:MAG: DUF2169 domain-containing protein [Pseudomonadota bacterium]
MELLNATGMQAGYTMGMEPSGRELLVVVVKGTFNIPSQGDCPTLADEQIPLVEADSFTGEPGLSAPVYESDFPPIKKRCDVLLNGSAYAPNGKQTNKVRVGLKFGSLSKTFTVVGDRNWVTGNVGISPGKPKEFVVMPISYDCAYGGLDNFHANEKKHAAFIPNPIGKGYHRNLSVSLVDGKPMPNTEEDNRAIIIPSEKYHPMSFGSVGRGWEPRLDYAGTYDQNWIDNIFPFLPPDFDVAYYQCAPQDQQVPYPKGGEEVVLVNLTPDGRLAFKLPEINVPVVFFRKNEENKRQDAVIDTVMLEPDKGLFTMTWRAHIPLKKNMFEIPQVLVGTKSKAWWRARIMGKTYYPSLDLLDQTKTIEAEEA